jgi:hypothetical protein
MVTVLRAAGTRFVIYLNDHEPAHVHVYGDGEARIDIVHLRAISNRGMSKRDLGRGLNIIFENQTMLLRRWGQIHE